jgi:hypothetical protein
LWSGTSIAFSEASQRVNTIYVNITRMVLAIVFLIVTMLLFGIQIVLSLSKYFFFRLAELLV